MTYLDFSKRSSESLISMHKIAIRHFWGIIVINFIIFLLEAITIYYEPSRIFPWMIIGICICNFLWMYLQFSMCRTDLKLEKEKLARIHEMEASDLYKQSLAMTKENSEFYKQFAKHFNYAYPENKPQESVSPVVET